MSGFNPDRDFRRRAAEGARDGRIGVRPALDFAGITFLMGGFIEDLLDLVVIETGVGRPD